VPSGQTIKVNKEIFSGFLEIGTSLEIILGATELDWLFGITRREKLARYRRRVTIKGPGELVLKPGDEDNDPESLGDWEVRLNIKIT